MYVKNIIKNVEDMNWFGRPSCYLYMPNTEFTFYTFFHTYVIYTCFILTLSVTLGPFVLSAPRRPGTTKRRASAVSRSMMKANFLRRTSEITWLKLKPMVSLEWLSRVFVVNRNWASWGVAKWLVVTSDMILYGKLLGHNTFFTIHNRGGFRNF